ncbi:MAG TPA: hypothetical protein VFM45_08185, partial [Anaeromyxobacteraceae bacterium]|nr:hypothetical protein [Anaeromyxobacteraceae bacterium]
MLTPLALALALAAAPEPATHKIAVLRLEASGVAPELAESATALVPTEVRRLRPQSRVFSSEDVRALLTHQKDRLVLGCGSDAACMAELGGALGADEIVAGRLGRLGETFVVELRRVEVAQARSLGSATRTVRRPDAIASAVVALVGELFGGPGAAGPGAVAGVPVAGQGGGRAGAAQDGQAGAGGGGRPGPDAGPAALPAGAVRLAFPPGRPGDERLPAPALTAEELELRPIRYGGSNHRAVYDLVRRLLADAGLPIEREWTDDDARLRLRSQWFAVERSRRVQLRVVVDGHVSL